MTSLRFQYTSPEKFPGIRLGQPLLPITLINGSHSVTIRGMVDSGSSVSVLPYDIGLQLGLVWEEQSIPAPLVGMLKDAVVFILCCCLTQSASARRVALVIGNR